MMDARLRKEAEKRIQEDTRHDSAHNLDKERVIHELNVHQIELELQNDELRRTTQQLEKSHKRFSDLFDHAPVGYVVMDKNTRILDVNFSATFMLCADKKNLKEKKFTQYIHPDHQDTFYFFLQKVMENDQLHTEEIKLKNEHDTYFFAQLQGVVDYDLISGQNRIRLVIIDISERKSIESKLKRFRAAIDSSSDNIFLINFDSGKFIDINDSACRNLGFTREEFLQMKPEDINPRYSYDFLMEISGQNFFDAQSEYTRELQHQRKDGSVIDVEVYLKPLLIDDEKIIVAVARDITERKRTQDQLARYADELKELNASKDRFLSIISHDLRGPFLGIKGYTQMLIEDLDTLDKKEVLDFLHKVLESSNDLYNLVDNLLKWSRLELGKTQFDPVPLNLHQELAPLMKLLNGLAMKKNIDLINHLQKEVYPEADRLMLISVTQNLVSNAIKFTPKGGKIIVRSSENPQGQITITVEDNGVGMSPQIMEKLFTLDKTHTSRGTDGEKGTGFGLIITKEMVKKMGGEIAVSSTPGKGSVFTFTLPNAPKNTAD